jgi:hypothetical protein
MLDNVPTGAGMAVTFGFQPKTDPPFPDGLVSMSGNEIVFKDTPRRGYTAQGYLTGYTGKPGEYSFIWKIEAMASESFRPPILHSQRFTSGQRQKTICPEAYIAINVAPGATQKWSIMYRFEGGKR